MVTFVLFLKLIRIIFLKEKVDYWREIYQLLLFLNKIIKTHIYESLLVL